MPDATPGVPETLYVNTTATLEFVDPRFPPSDGWSAELVVRGAAVVTLTGSAVGGSRFQFEVAADTFNSAAIGSAEWTIIVSRATPAVERVVAAAGRTSIAEDPAAALAVPGGVTTHAERMLAAIEAVLERRATTDQQAYTIDGRSLTRMGFDELVRARELYRRKVQTEATLAARGLSRSPMKVRTRLA